MTGRRRLPSPCRQVRVAVFVVELPERGSRTGRFLPQSAWRHSTTASHVKPAPTSFPSSTHPHHRTTALSTHPRPPSPWPSNPSPAYVAPLGPCAPPTGPCDWKLTSACADAPPNHCARPLRCHGCVTFTTARASSSGSLTGLYRLFRLPALCH